MKNWYVTSYGSLAYKYILSVYSLWFIRLSNALVFHIQSLQILIFCMDDQKYLANLDYVILFYFVTLSKLITFGSLYYIVTFSFFLFCALFLYFFLCPYNSIKSVDWILLSSLLLNAILLTSSVNRLCFLLLFLCCDFKINRLFFRNFLWFSPRLATATPFYFNCLFYFQGKLLLKHFYNGYIFYWWRTSLCLLLFRFFRFLVLMW